jgi:GNAT superfamily N-acetyltransferase
MFFPWKIKNSFFRKLVNKLMGYGKMVKHYLPFFESINTHILIEIKEVTGSEAGMKAFVKFPFGIYKNSPYWVPPIIADELESFDTQKNPVFEHAKARFFVAYRNAEQVGRVAAIVNSYETEQQNIKKMRFGWLDFVDDVAVSSALFAKIEEIGRQQGLLFMEGPMGFSNLDKVGVMTYGYEELGTMITWYNHPYYIKHYENYGFSPEKLYDESRILFENIPPEGFRKAEKLIKERYQLRSLSFTKTKDLLPYANEMFELFNQSYAKLASFVAISDKQKAYFQKKYLNFINPEFIKFVVDAEGKMVGFGVIMPSFSEALQKAKGSLFPFGFWHLLRARARVKVVNFYLIGVHPSYQNKGVTALIFSEFYNSVQAKGVHTLLRTPELADNHAIHSIFKDFKPEVYVRRCTYKKDL